MMLGFGTESEREGVQSFAEYPFILDDKQRLLVRLARRKHGPVLADQHRLWSAWMFAAALRRGGTAQHAEMRGTQSASLLAPEPHQATAGSVGCSSERLSLRDSTRLEMQQRRCGWIMLRRSREPAWSSDRDTPMLLRSLFRDSNNTELPRASDSSDVSSSIMANRRPRSRTTNLIRCPSRWLKSA